ncbi:hypothetical protein IWW48_005702 [Coemansia sp. RSA 1200]|nr:hypothetical protein IWW48_005702 [Coemansia sp. RSA 1200]
MSDLFPQRLHTQSRNLGRLVGTLFGSREAEQPPASVPSHRPPVSDDDDMSVPDLLKPTVQRYAARWTATRERHDTNARKAKLVDAQLQSLYVSLHAQLEAVQALSQETSLLKESKGHLSELADEAARMKPALSALEGLYASLAAADTQRAGDLAQQESEHRSARHQHYLELQLEMDKQYEELQRNSVHARAAQAERSFQQDLEMYRQRKSQADTTAYQQPSHRTSSGLAQQQDGSTRDIGDVVLSAGDWGRAMAQDDSFFSDDDTGSTLQHQKLKQKQRKQEHLKQQKEPLYSHTVVGIEIADIPNPSKAVVAAGSSKDGNSNSNVSSTSGDTRSSRKAAGVVRAHGAKASGTMEPTTSSTVSQRSPRPPASPELLPPAMTGHSSDSEDMDAASAVVILQDEDFL